MSSNWKTFITPLEGGLNLFESQINLSSQQPGSAINLINLEINPNKTGYSKIKGFQKFSETKVPDGGIADSKIKGVYALSDDTAIVNRNKDIYVSTGGSWAKLTSTPLSVESVKMVGTSYRFTGNRKTMLVDGSNDPYYIDNTTLNFTQLSSPPSDVTGASRVIVFNNRLWFAKGPLLTFTAPNTDDDFDTGNGAGVINTGDTIVGLGLFSNFLIVFHVNGIKKISGDTTANFVIEDLFKSAGCVDGDTIQNIKGDLVYLSQDGVKFLTDTDSLTGFSLNDSEKKVGQLITENISQYSAFSSCVVSSKNQYRLFFYDEDRKRKSHFGFCGTQKDSQKANLDWCSILGIKVFSCSRSEDSSLDFILFSDDTEYIYVMERGSSFDGENIPWSYWSPYLFLDDPIKRKTVYNVYFYGLFPEETDATLSVRIDFKDPSVIQPSPMPRAIATGSVDGGIYDFSFYGSAIYGTEPVQKYVFKNIGNGEFFSFQLYGSGQEKSFTIDNLVLEYNTKDRQ